MSTPFINAEVKIKFTDKIGSQFPKCHIVPMVAFLDKLCKMIVNRDIFVVSALCTFAFCYHIFKLFILDFEKFQYGIIYYTNTQKRKFHFLCGCKTLVLQHIFINRVDTPPYVV